MYQSHFRFENYPFQNTPNPAFFFGSQTHREALASMLYGVQNGGKGFILITGDVGTGKTTLVQALKVELGDQHIVIEIGNPWVSHEDILNTIRRAIAVTDTGQTEPFIINTLSISALKDRLTELDERGRRAVLVVDEAHQLPERTLEGIRLISNIETPTRKLIQIILLGQDELGTMLSRYSMRQIEQRIGLAFHLSKLSREDTEAYIRHRLRIAGGSDALFPSESIDIIYPTSQGIPRIINHLCDACLLTAYQKNANFVDAETAREVIASVHPMQASASPAPMASPRAAAADSIPPREPPSHALPLPDFNPPHEPPPREPPPREPPNRAVPLPHFFLPEAEEWDDREQEPAGVRWRYVLLALLLGLAAGAAAIWGFMQYDLPSDPLARARTNQQAGSPGQKSPEPAPAIAENMRPRIAQELYPKGSAAPATPTGEVPFPVDPARITRVEVVTVTREMDVSIVASRKFGAWNETVQDIILGVNPELASLANLPPNTAVKLPVLNREHMIVQDNKGGVYVYYATFASEAMARENLETLKKIWAGAFIVTVQRGGVPVNRIYLGKYDTLSTAESMVRSTWFKYLPNLN